MAYILIQLRVVYKCKGPPFAPFKYVYFFQPILIWNLNYYWMNALITALMCHNALVTAWSLYLLYHRMKHLLHTKKQKILAS